MLLSQGCPAGCAFDFYLTYLSTHAEDLEKIGNYSKGQEKGVYLPNWTNTFIRIIKFGKSNINTYNSFLDVYFSNNHPHLWLTVAFLYFLIRYYKNGKIFLDLFLKIIVTDSKMHSARPLSSLVLWAKWCELNMSAWEGNSNKFCFSHINCLMVFIDVINVNHLHSSEFQNLNRFGLNIS